MRQEALSIMKLIISNQYVWQLHNLYFDFFKIENLKLKTKTLQCSQFLHMNIDDNSKLQSSTLAVKKTIHQNCNIV